MAKKSYNMTSVEGYSNPGLESSTVEITQPVTMTNPDPKLDSKKESADEKEKKPLVAPVGFLEFFKYSTCSDRGIIFVAVIASLIHGLAFPLMILVFGDMIDLFGSAQFIDDNLSNLLEKWNITNLPKNATYEMKLGALKSVDPTFDLTSMPIPTELLDQMRTFSLYYIGLGVGVMIVGYLQVTCWMIPSQRQTFRIRNKFFRSIMRQEIGWFDMQSSGDLTTRISDDINKIQEGMGDKLGQAFQWTSTCIAGLALGFFNGWKLTLVICAISPVLAVSAYVFTKLVSSYTNQGLSSYAKAGAIAEEVLGAIRTVAAFGGEKKEEARYMSNLGDARSSGIRKGLVTGVSMGFIWFVIFCGYGLAFWYGAELSKTEEQYTAGKIIIIFFSILMACMALGQGAPNIEAVSTGRAAAGYIFKIIERKSLIDSSNDEGATPGSISGDLELRDVAFAYPSRPDVTVMNGFSLKVPSGKTTALVGSSGCGKSSSVNLIQRFYDPKEGAVLLDGQDIRGLNVSWLRSHIGLVSQEPVLFACSIAENIRYGRDGLTQKDIENACAMSNAKDFIEQLPLKYDTLVGDRGTQLSGGQKQRIAIARALVRNPKILLLDEATSALDTESEGLVQAALDKARLGRTTVVVAHRLSTVRTADYIAGISDGRVQEVGSHDELMACPGIYSSLVQGQSSGPTATGTEKIVESESEDEDELTNNNESQPLHKMSDSAIRGRTLSIESNGVHNMERGQAPRSKADGGICCFKKSKVNTEEKEEVLPSPSFGRLMALNKTEAGYVFIGCVAALLNGAVQPSYAIIFGELISIISNPNAADSEINLWCGMFVVVGAVAFISFFAQSSSFAKSGEELTLRCRHYMFQAMLRQDIAWFDDPKNNLGALTTRLATDASLIQGATGVRLGTGCQALSSLGVGVIIAFIFEWRLALVILAFVPFIMLGGLMQIAVMQGTSAKDKVALETAGKVAVEGIESIRTVVGLSQEGRFEDDYKAALSVPYETSLRRSHVQGFSFGLSMCVMFFCYAAAFYYGAYLIGHRITNMADMFKVFGALVFGAMAVGQASGFAPDVGKAQSAAAAMFVLLDREPIIDVSSDAGVDVHNVGHGEVGLSEVRFQYPTRRNIPVLRSVSFTAKPGQMVALVGASGCGKSTIIQLIQRFYDPYQGIVFVNGKPLTECRIGSSRRALGLVQQEPILFDYSVRENISYGDLSRDVPMAEVIHAAQSANIHSFVEKLPQGYDTLVGEKGGQLSGGQKQRIAIARALVRNPKILLLDEATSALDNESEKIVQEALDKAQEGRTSLVIAHRLSTIRNADVILVFHRGKIRESGTHDSLIHNKGIYYKLVSRQT